MRAHEFADQGAAGCILYAEDTGRYGFQQRSNKINDPGLWAAWGGGREPGESLEQCARRELAEESGYTGPVKLQRLAENARYVTFIGTVPHEFEPRPDPEWQDYCWVKAGDWPSPMHPGVTAAVKNIAVTEAVNPDIVKPNFTAEKTIDIKDVGAVKLTAHNISTDHPPQFRVDVINDQGKNIGYFRFIVVDWEPEPKYRIFSRFAKRKDPYVIGGNVNVWKEYQRRGIARAVYQWVKSMGNDIKPSTTQTSAGQAMWRGFAADPIEENFADKKVKGKSRPGRVRRAGASCSGSVTDLRAKAKKYGGERGRMYHWCANMKGGRNK